MTKKKSRRGGKKKSKAAVTRTTAVTAIAAFDQQYLHLTTFFRLATVKMNVQVRMRGHSRRTVESEYRDAIKKSGECYNKLLSLYDEMLDTPSVDLDQYVLLARLMTLQNYQMEISIFPGAEKSQKLEALIERTATLINSQERNQLPSRSARLTAIFRANAATIDDPKKAIQRAFYQYITERYVSLITGQPTSDSPSRDFATELLFMIQCMTQICTLTDVDAACEKLPVVEHSCEHCSDEALEAFLGQAIPQLIHSIVSEDVEINSELMTLIKYIEVMPTHLGVTYNRYLTPYSGALYKHASYQDWLRNSTQRQQDYITTQARHDDLVSTEEASYHKRCLRERARRRQQERDLEEQIQLRALQSRPEYDSDGDGDEESKDDPIPMPTKRYFPYMDDCYETICCDIHLRLNRMIQKVRALLASAIRKGKADHHHYDFSKARLHLDDLLRTIDEIGDNDNPNHMAQKAMFKIGCYLQFVRAHKHRLTELGSHLTYVADCNQRAKLILQRLPSSEMAGMSVQYRDALRDCQQQIDVCHTHMVAAIERNSQHTCAIVERYRSHRARRRAAGLPLPQPKKRGLWHPGSLTFFAARDVLVDRRGVAFDAFRQLKMFGTAATASEVTATSPEKTAGPSVAASLKQRHHKPTEKTVIEAVEAIEVDTEATATLIDSSSWLYEENVPLRKEDEDFIEYNHPQFLAIMSALERVNLDIARRMRLHGGALRDFLIDPKASPKDLDFEFFGTHEELSTLFPSVSRPIFIENSGYGAVLVKAHMFVEGKRVDLDITLHHRPDDPTDAAHRMSLHTNADLTTNGLFTFLLPGGRYAILNHHGFATPHLVMEALESQQDLIAAATCSEDPVLILRILKYYGEFKCEFSERVMAQLHEADKAFDYVSLAPHIKGHFAAYFRKETHNIMKAGSLLASLPNISALLQKLKADPTYAQHGEVAEEKASPRVMQP